MHMTFENRLYTVVPLQNNHRFFDLVKSPQMMADILLEIVILAPDCASHLVFLPQVVIICEYS